MAPWPRKLVNFPIIMIAIALQFLEATALVWDLDASGATSIHILAHIFPLKILPGILLVTTTLAVIGFFLRRKISTLLCLAPQQFLLYLSAGGSFEAIWEGHYADGVIRPHAFIFTDQLPIILIAIFHTWAMILILLHGEDE